MIKDREFELFEDNKAKVKLYSPDREYLLSPTARKDVESYVKEAGYIVHGYDIPMPVYPVDDDGNPYYLVKPAKNLKPAGFCAEFLVYLD